jgi:hypothetical protein
MVKTIKVTFYVDLWPGMDLSGNPSLTAYTKQYPRIGAEYENGTQRIAFEVELPDISNQTPDATTTAVRRI